MTILRKTRVVHCKKSAYDVYIGRPSQFGNPFPLDNPGDKRERAAVIDQYRVYFEQRVSEDGEFRAAVARLRGLRLGCWCAPRPCHGDVIAAWLDSTEC